MKSETYEAGSQLGHRLNFSNGEFLVYEPQPGDAYSFSWSSGLPVSTLLQRTRYVFEKLDDFVEGCVVLDDGQDIEGSVEDVLACINANLAHVIFFRLDAPTHAFGWKAGVGVHSRHPDVTINECGFIATEPFDSYFYRSMIGELATETIGEDLDTEGSSAVELLGLRSGPSG